jgi:hypothetical protein
MPVSLSKISTSAKLFLNFILAFKGQLLTGHLRKNREVQA